MDKKLPYEQLYYNEQKKRNKLIDGIRFLIASISKNINKYSEEALKEEVRRIRERLEKLM